MAKLKLSDLPQTPAPPSRDPRQLLLERAAKRLVQLLKESDDRESEMREIVHRLDAQDLLGWSPTMDKGPHQFAMEVVEENLLLREHVPMRNEFRPETCETPGDLLSHLLPAFNDHE